MVISISLLVCIAIIIYSLYYKDSAFLIFLLFPVLLGFGLLGIKRPVKTKSTFIPVSITVNEDLGKCWICETECKEITDYSDVKLCIKLSGNECNGYVVVERIDGINSYGFSVEYEYNLNKK